MAAPKGNRNAKRGTEWRQALNKALKMGEYEGVERGHALRRIAERVVLGALTGDKDCWQEIGNRLDGKATEYVDVGRTDSAEDLSDEQLLDIIRGRSEGAAGSEKVEKQPTGLH